MRHIIITWNSKHFNYITRYKCKVFVFLFLLCLYFSAFMVSSLMEWFNYLRVSQLSSLSENCLFTMPWTDLKWNSSSPFVPRAFLTTKEVLVLLSPHTSPGHTSQSRPLLPKSPSSTHSRPPFYPPAQSPSPNPHTQGKGCHICQLVPLANTEQECGDCAVFLGT